MAALKLVIVEIATHPGRVGKEVSKHETLTACMDAYHDLRTAKRNVQVLIRDADGTYIALYPDFSWMHFI